MKQEEKDQLEIFGFGLALLIPLFIVIHFIKVHINFWIFCLLIVIALTVVAKVQKMKPLYFLSLIGIYVVLFMELRQHGLGVISFIFIVISLGLIPITICNVALLKPVYDKWMVIAGFIGHVISTLAMSLIFFVVFMPIGIFFRIIKIRDPLF